MTDTSTSGASKKRTPKSTKKKAAKPSAAAKPVNAGNLPVCVDLDGTVLRSDTLWESLFALLRVNPFVIFHILFWLRKGRSVLKAEIASRVDLDPASLPYNEEVLERLRVMKAKGHKLYLVSASNEKYVNQIADHLGIFEGVEASTSEHNLKSENKAARLNERFGKGNYIYAGNSRDDIAVWQDAASAIVVEPDTKAANWAKSAPLGTEIIASDKSKSKTFLKAIRIHQWLKNSLIFIPLVLDHRIFDLGLLFQACIGFIAFGLCASSVYLLNDLLDLPLDRRHSKKRFRPLAAGTLPLQQGIFAAGGFFIAAFLLAAFLPGWFFITLAFYYITTLSYSLFLKKMLLIDVFTLAALFTIRVIAGGAATGIEISSWLLAFSVFFFLSLALVKRFVELNNHDGYASRETTGRGYQSVDFETLAQAGMASGFAAVTVLALFVDSSASSGLYNYPQLIWLVCPPVLYLIIRIWILARRNEMDEDPVLFMIQDWRSQIMIAAGAIVFAIAALV